MGLVQECTSAKVSGISARVSGICAIVGLVQELVMDGKEGFLHIVECDARSKK